MAVSYRITVGNWHSARRDATAIRAEVFVREQHVPRELELDARDADSIHALAYDGILAIGTGRLLPDAHIGRMAVRKPYRRRGVGSLLLEALLAEARRRGDGEVVLAAQLHAIPFYRRHGFVAEGAVFLDAGIEHITMRQLPPRTA
ncbi:MAG: GNAT family N-acetyltransferase [Candidimonas sp.]|nr:MAG: GNAT family N-acetyltransferase [Candidimonas sp.]